MSGNCGAGCLMIVSEGIVCNVIFHPKCAGMNLATVRIVKALAYFNWFCNACGHKYAGAAMKESTTTENLSNQSSELRQLVVDCSTKIEASVMCRDKSPNRRQYSVPKNGTPAKFERRNNLIIAGSHPPPAGLEHLDHLEVEAICKVLKVDYDSDFTITRLKKKDPNSKQLPLMRLEFSSPKWVTRSGLLKNVKKLCGATRFSDIYIRPDLNNAQIERNKILVAELKRRRGLGHDMIIGKNGKVIERS